MKEDKVLQEWNDKISIEKKRARKLVWKTRLSIGFSVLRALLIIFLIYYVYMVGVSIYYHQSGNSQEFERFVSTLVETRHPGIHVERQIQNTEISPFLTQKTSAKVYRNVGGWKVVVGELTADKKLFSNVYYTIDYNTKYLGDSTPYYIVAPNLMDRSIVAQDDNRLVNQLNKIEDGYVVQVLFSTKEGMEPEKLRELLAEYDLDVYQMPVYSGELKEFNDVNHFGSSDFTSVDSLMLRPQTVYDNEHRLSQWRISLKDKETLEDSIDQFYTDLEWLINHGKYFDRDIDEKRSAYLQENGMQVYGATVTGPIREIERLMEEEMLYQFQLGGIEVWNWPE